MAAVMEGEGATILWQVLIGAGLVFGVSLFPSLAILRILDPLSDNFRKILLAPAISLLVTYGLAGWMVITSGKFDIGYLLLLLIIANCVALLALWERDVVRVRRLSTWEFLEEKNVAMAEEGVEAEAAIDPESEDGGTKVTATINDEETVRVEEDVEAERNRFQEMMVGRSGWLPVALVSAALFTILPLFLFKYPNGVDWIGFSTLSHRLATVGELSLPAVSSGTWTYPPAFPAIAALLESVLGLTPASSVHLLGQLSLLALLWGVAGAADRWGASGPTLLALALAPALFVKAHDSGYPTIASQLGLVLGLLVLMRPAAERRRGQDIAFALGVVATGAIHPTGSLFLGTLLAAYLIVHRFGAKSSKQISRIVFTSSILLALAALTVLLAYAPRLLSEPIYSEYGWQGGATMILFNGPVILGLAAWSAWRGRASLEVLLVSCWFGLNWALSLVHLLAGVIAFPIFTLLSYVLYSMALHAFHLPLAVLVGLLLAKNARLTPRLKPLAVDESGEMMVQEMLDASRRLGVEAVVESATAVAEGVDEEMWIPMELPEPIPKRWTYAVLLIVVIQLAAANAMLIELSGHPELRPQTDGDRALMSTLSLPAGSVLFTEDAHWGNPYDLSEEVSISNFPSLGLVEVDYSIQGQARSAILRDDVEKISELGISHALSSPMGTFGDVLATSLHWELMKDIDGSRLWLFQQQPTTESAVRSEIVYPTEAECDQSCEWRIDPWWMVDADQLLNRPDSQPFLTEGTITLTIPLGRDARDKTVRINGMIDAPAGLQVELYVIDGHTTQGRQFTTGGGWEQLTLITHTSTSDSVQVRIDVKGGGDNWINPLGASGRGDRLIDQDGVRIHWVELRPMVA
jgi:hypothetical protein